MLRTPPAVTAIFLACVTAVTAADFENLFFTSNASRYACGIDGYVCEPPSICVTDSVTKFYYCCDPGATHAQCWKPAPACDGGGPREPSGSQRQCSTGNNAFCCLKDFEKCTAVRDQVRICFNVQDNPVANLSDEKINDIFSSLSSARPSASSYPVLLAHLQAEASPTTSLPVSPSQSSLVEVSATATPIVTDSSTVSESSGHNGMSGGAIGGIVGGVVGGLVLIGLMGFLLFRRRKARSKGDHAPIASGSPPEHGQQNFYEPNPYYHQHAAQTPAPGPTEKCTRSSDATPAIPYRYIPELQAQGIHEMQENATSEMDGGETVRRA